MSQVKTRATGERGFQPKPINVGQVAWKSLNWKKIEKVVFQLQKRIYRASQNGNVILVRRLQKLLSKSYYAKCLAVRKVTQDNAGRKTAGIDGRKSLNYSQRLKLINDLELTSKASPLRRVFIPKPGTTEKRGLGIPTLQDRATQMLAQLVLEPEWEAKFEPNSYGFRPGRSCHDAINAIYKQLWSKLRSWARHRGNGSINKDKYWRKKGNQNWSFETEEGLRLLTHSEVPIVRHIKVQNIRSPFDGDWVYWGQRLSRYHALSSRKQKLLNRQQGKCPHCGLYFHPEELTEVDHIHPTSKGGQNQFDNLQLLHKHCHDEKTATNFSLCS
jgi:N-terminal domain of reverse transcriptase/HNH endonuclease/Reverse transcriptase (RNA-dependent DNA polymerase)